jgi:hypothetical protein
MVPCGRKQETHSPLRQGGKMSFDMHRHQVLAKWHREQVPAISFQGCVIGSRKEDSAGATGTMAVISWLCLLWPTVLLQDASVFCGSKQANDVGTKFKLLPYSSQVVDSSTHLQIPLGFGISYLRFTITLGRGNSRALTFYFLPEYHSVHSRRAHVGLPDNYPSCALRNWEPTNHDSPYAPIHGNSHLQQNAFIFTLPYTLLWFLGLSGNFKSPELSDISKASAEWPLNYQGTPFSHWLQRGDIRQSKSFGPKAPLVLALLALGEALGVAFNIQLE